ncbi:MAG: restriction endonuclease subunit S [Halobacteriota archaeon]
MKHLFTYGPVSLEEVENVPLKETEIGMVPDEWPLLKLKDIFKITSGKTRPKQFKSIASDVFIYPIYGGNGIMGYSEKSLIDFPTIIIGRVGAYCGSVYVSKSKSWISDNALYARDFRFKKIDLNYLATALKLLNLNRLKNQGGQPLISQSIVYSQFVPIPTLPVQQKIASILSAVDRKIEAEQTKKKALDDLFKTLLNILMTGKLRVNHLEVK